MARELIVELIRKKRDLYKQKYDTECEKLAIEEEYFLANESEISEKDQKIDDVEIRLAKIRERVIRAHTFGLKHAKGQQARCIDCFVEREEIPDMHPVTSNATSNYLFKCSSCGHEVVIAPQ